MWFVSPGPNHAVAEYRAVPSFFGQGRSRVRPSPRGDRHTGPQNSVPAAPPPSAAGAVLPKWAPWNKIVPLDKKVRVCTTTRIEVVNDRAVDGELADLLGWHGPPAQIGLSWTEVESSLGIRLPSDYRRLMSRFPSGAFAERFYVYSPVQSTETLEVFQDEWRSRLGWLREVRSAPNSAIHYPIYPEPGGLIPWGSGNEHTYYWKPSEGTDPNSWTVVFAERLSINWGEYPGPMSFVATPRGNTQTLLATTATAARRQQSGRGLPARRRLGGTRAKMVNIG